MEKKSTDAILKSVQDAISSGEAETIAKAFIARASEPGRRLSTGNYLSALLALRGMLTEAGVPRESLPTGLGFTGSKAAMQGMGLAWRTPGTAEEFSLGGDTIPEQALRSLPIIRPNIQVTDENGKRVPYGKQLAARKKNGGRLPANWTEEFFGFLPSQTSCQWQRRIVDPAKWEANKPTFGTGMTGDYSSAVSALVALAKKNGADVREDAMDTESGMAVRASEDRQWIALNPIACANSGDAVHTLAHEIAHVLLGHTEEDNKQDRAEKEREAELAALLFTATIATEEDRERAVLASSAYLGNYSQGDPKKVYWSLNSAGKIADKMIDAVKEAQEG